MKGKNYYLCLHDCMTEESEFFEGQLYECVDEDVEHLRMRDERGFFCVVDKTKFEKVED